MNIDKIDNGFLIYNRNTEGQTHKFAFNTWEMALEWLKDNEAQSEPEGYGW